MQTTIIFHQKGVVMSLSLSFARHVRTRRTWHAKQVAIVIGLLVGFGMIVNLYPASQQSCPAALNTPRLGLSSSQKRFGQWVKQLGTRAPVIKGTNGEQIDIPAQG